MPELSESEVQVAWPLPARTRNATVTADAVIAEELCDLQEEPITPQQELLKRSEHEWGSSSWSYSGLGGATFRFDCRTQRFHTGIRGLRKTVCVTPSRGWSGALEQAVAWCLEH